MTRRFLSLLLIVATLFALPPAVPTSAAPRCFPEAGPAITDCIDGRLKTFWEEQGGLPVFGYPLTPAYQEPTDAGLVTVQFFERARLEHHPQNTPPYDVLLGRLGADDLARQGFPPFPRDLPREGCRFFAETGQNICPPFLQTWQQYGLELGDPGVSQAESLALFGLPLSPPRPLTLKNGTTVTAQWFERARFEDHGPQGVLLGLLGRELVEAGAVPDGIPQSPRPQQESQQQPAPETFEGFINVSGTQLTRLGQPIRLKGVNYYPQGRPWAAMWQIWDGPQIERELRLARDQLGINAVRILFPYKQSFDPSSEKKVEKRMLERLREITQIAGSLDMRLIVTLFDFYNDFPPAGSVEDAENLIYLRTLIGNFAGDDRIFAWDLHNEPDHYPMWKEGNAPRVLDWLGRMADEVHRLAPHHLVTVGMGQYHNLWAVGPDGRSVLDYSDIISVHIYNAADATRQLDEVRARTSKPILLQEFGWPTGPKCSVRDYNEQHQAEFYNTMLAAAEGRVVGIFAWTLRDYDPGPTDRWDTREEHYGLYRPDSSLKPAAQAFAAYAVEPLPSHTITNHNLTKTDYKPYDGEKAPRFFPETGHFVKDWFRLLWDNLDGMRTFGLPLSEAFVHPGTGRVTQYFQMAKLEIVPYAEKDPIYPQLSRIEQAMHMVRPLDLGHAYADGRVFPQAVSVPAYAERFPETGYSVGGAFLDFYKQYNGSWRLGAPISEELVEDVAGEPKVVQYFERGRLEWNEAGKFPEFSHLGTWAWDMQCRSVGQ